MPTGQCSVPSIPRRWGLAGRDAWPEIWDSQLHALLAGVVQTGEAFWAKDLLFELERHGFPEETYFDVSYDPVRVESGEVGGVYCIVTETTERVVGERRMALLKDLAAGNAKARTVADACVLATQTLAGAPTDLRFALAYLGDELQCSTLARPNSSRARHGIGQEPVHRVVDQDGQAARLIGRSQSQAPVRRAMPRRLLTWLPISSPRRSPTPGPTSTSRRAEALAELGTGRRRPSSVMSVTSSVAADAARGSARRRPR